MSNGGFVTADVGQTNLAAFDPIDFEKYQDGGNSFAPPPEGRYMGKAPMITDECFAATAEGYLKLKLDPIEIVSQGVGNGYKIKYSQFSAKKYAKREGSQVLDFLRACGIAARPKSIEELKSALKMASGRTFQFALVWEAYNKDTQESTSGQDNFPDGLTYIKDGDKKWYANGKVRYFVSAVGK